MHSPQSSLSNHISKWPVLTAALVMIPSMARGDFKGSDSLALDVGNWGLYNYAGDGTLQFRNSRLEFLVGVPQIYNSALAVWRPNASPYQKSWFLQVDVHLDKPVVPANSAFEMGITVDSTSAASGSCSMMMGRTNDASKETGGFVLKDGGLVFTSMDSAAKSATMRLHFDASGTSLVGSVNDGSGWKYSDPLNILTWGMGAKDLFHASLYGQNFGAVAAGLANGSGPAYFKNFVAGPAAAEIVVQQPKDSVLKDGRARTAFGSVSIKRKKRSKVYLIANDGTAPLEDLQISVNGLNARDFVVTQPTSTLLMPGGRTLFKVTFRPKAKGNRKAVLHIKSNDFDEASFDVNLGGKGVK
jgi:hypothetical protein